MAVGTVAIIGAGPSGLVSAKEALACGLDPTIFEQGDSLGGVWKPNGGKTWEGMRINNSVFAACFSDYDWEEKTDPFPNQRRVYEYLQSYAKHFDLTNKLQLSTTVTKIERQAEKWLVQWVDGQKKESSCLYNYVMVCSGIFSRAFTPAISGLKTFSGSVSHSADYKTPTPFEGKVVAVIGNAFSGCEIAAEVSKTAKKVVHIFNQAKWIMPRKLNEQENQETLPFDIALYKRNVIYPARDTNDDQETRYKKSNHFYNQHSDQNELTPDLYLSPDSANPPFVAISDSYLPQVRSNRILPKKAKIEKIEKNTLYLSDGSELRVDGLLFCTGYRAELPFFNSQMKEDLGFVGDDPLQPLLLHKTVFHPKFQNMAFVGLCRVGVYFGLVELQARLATMTLSGKISWPTEEMMVDGIQAEKDIREMNPRTQFSRGYIPFCDELAYEIGALPPFNKLAKDNSPLYEKIWKGPFTSSSYRLFGFGNNPGVALKIINELNELTSTSHIYKKYQFSDNFSLTAKVSQLLFKDLHLFNDTITIRPAGYKEILVTAMSVVYVFSLFHRTV